jgi:hypothetical protein
MADSAHIINLPRRALLACAVLLSIANAVVIAGIVDNLTSAAGAAPTIKAVPAKASGWSKPPLWI